MSQRELISRLHPLHIAFSDDGSLHFCSKSIEILFPKAESIFDMFAPNSANELLDCIRDLKQNALECAEIDIFSIQTYTTWQCKLALLDEQSHWLLCMADSKKQVDAAGNDIRLGANQDTELLRQNLFYEAMLHQLPAEVAVFDKDYKFLFVNKQAIKNEELRKWLIGRSEIEYWKSKSLPLDKAYQRIEGFQNAISEKKSTAVGEIFHPGTEQEKHYIRVTHPYFIEDELQFLLTYGVDITSLKQTEAKLIQQNSELEKVNAELDQFVYSASHNLRAPLLSMKGLLSLISLEDTAFEDRNRFMVEVYKSIERLDATIHDIIEYSKNARLPIQPEEIDLLTIVHSTIDDLKFFDQSRVKISVSSDIHAPLLSDTRRIRSIIHNLISNGVKYADTTKSDCYLNISVQTNSAGCTLQFSDNGIGIAHENQERVFDMFYRGTSQRTGSGLGLYIVKEMVSKLEGAISLTSAQGIGTTVTVILPNNN
ncbi:MAG: sensor histidine kinase [Flavobacteriales bacterium]|jgi:signal transduction histidine kinase